MAEIPRKAKEILQAYEDVFSGGSGLVVLDDMRAAYHDVSAAEEHEDLSHIPPEARVWFIEGRRDVYLSILRAMELNITTTTSENEE